mmetsp:Transcript_12330/g.35821  ORF Transcript_12330/g.35821 Transcript_12330/m.35821 type:complete len:295 (-) Transcript_12330:266-1150(-)
MKERHTLHPRHRPLRRQPPELSLVELHGSRVDDGGRYPPDDGQLESHLPAPARDVDDATAAAQVVNAIYRHQPIAEECGSFGLGQLAVGGVRVVCQPRGLCAAVGHHALPLGAHMGVSHMQVLTVGPVAYTAGGEEFAQSGDINSSGIAFTIYTHIAPIGSFSSRSRSTSSEHLMVGLQVLIDEALEVAITPAPLPQHPVAMNAQREVARRPILLGEAPCGNHIPQLEGLVHRHVHTGCDGGCEAGRLMLVRAPINIILWAEVLGVECQADERGVGGAGLRSRGGARGRGRRSA